MFFGPSLLIMPCGRCAALPQIGSGRVDEQIEPVDRLLDPRAALGPDRAVDICRSPGSVAPHWSLVPSASRRATPRGEAACRGRNRRRAARAECRLPRRSVRRAGRQTLRVAAGRHDTVEIDLGLAEIRLPKPCSPIRAGRSPRSCASHRGRTLAAPSPRRAG